MATDPFKSLTVSYVSGERIISAGETGACVFVVQSGTIRLLRSKPGESAPLEIARLDKGDVFGERALVEGVPYGVDAEAVSDCEVVEIGAPTFQKLLRGNSELAERMLGKLAGRLDRLEQRITQQETAPPKATVAPALAPAPAPPKAVTAVPIAASRPAPSSTVRPATTPATKAGNKAAAKTMKKALPSARLVLEGGAVTFPLSGTEMLVGRFDPVTELHPEVDLTAVDTKRSVSRRHARLTYREGAWHLSEEIGALNGTFVNGVKLLAGHAAPLAEGDLVSVGMVRLVYRQG